ncbi:kelch domain-containing protein 10 homolog [Microplitis mediator]|uniref:kelch domain-containing protein 10 homolog n=1 Tax=Microplitis mediator TaxID=375433 RepID=UPI0025541047|nr:kelch domain-containing protein 10 homolog [Microplitis mediator]
MYAFKPYVFTEHASNGGAEPEGRMKSTIRCDGKNLYVYEAMDPYFVPKGFQFRDIWVYNLARQQWRLTTIESNLPDDDDVIVSSIFESIYLVICTIRVPFNDEPVSRICRLHICDLNTESEVVQATSGQIPYHFLAHNLIRHGTYIYIVGITRDNEIVSDVYKLNIENGVWEVVYICQGLDANEPRGRINHTLVYGNNMIYIFGGAGGHLGVNVFSFIKISAFDLENCCWKVVKTHGDENYIPHYPNERDHFGVTSYTDPDSGEINVIISGGTVDYNDAFNDVWRLNLTSLKWSCLQRFGTALPHHVVNHSMTVSPAGKLFTVGGCIYTNDMEQESCSSTLHSSWIRIPKLTDICWEAVLHYYPNLKSMTDKEIISLGIPMQSFKSRID